MHAQESVPVALEQIRIFRRVVDHDRRAPIIRRLLISPDDFTRLFVIRNNPAAIDRLAVDHNRNGRGVVDHEVRDRTMAHMRCGKRSSVCRAAACGSIPGFFPHSLSGYGIDLPVPALSEAVLNAALRIYRVRRVKIQRTCFIILFQNDARIAIVRNVHCVHRFERVHVHALQISAVIRKEGIVFPECGRAFNAPLTAA